MVSWSLGSPNGSGWGRTEVTVGGVLATANPGATSVEVPNVPTGPNLPVTVVAFNAEGDQSAAATTTLNVATVPAPIAAPTLSGIGEAGKVRVDGLAPVPGRGFDASSLTLRYAESPGACATGPQVSNGEILLVSGWQPTTFYFCQTGTGLNNRPAASDAVAAVGQASGAPSQVNVVFTSVTSSSVTVHWDPVGANPAVSEIRVSVGGQTQTVGAGSTEATFTGLAQGARYDASVVAVNAMGSTPMNARPITTTKLDVSAQWVETCSGNERGYFVGPCHTFTLSAPGWDDGASIPHICTVRSDRDNSTATVRVDGAGPIPSRVVTLADSADVFNRGQYILGECKPER